MINAYSGLEGVRGGTPSPLVTIERKGKVKGSIPWAGQVLREWKTCTAKDDSISFRKVLRNKKGREKAKKKGVHHRKRPARVKKSFQHASTTLKKDKIINNEEKVKLELQSQGNWEKKRWVGTECLTSESLELRKKRKKPRNQL